MYDIIGDIHGYADSLVLLLHQLGYDTKHGYFSHPGRKAIFTGDFIDRGPKIRETLQIIRPMIENNAALAVMGNHEYNAICYHTKGKAGEFLREHSQKNKIQYQETLHAFRDYWDEWRDYLLWFRTLPLFLELDGIRVIHACWDFTFIKYVKARLPYYKLNWDFLLESVKRGTKAYEAIEVLIKGKEINIPPHVSYIDKDGIKRKSVRLKWWTIHENPTYQSVAVNFEPSVPNEKLAPEILADFVPYPETEIPVFVGHYWQKGDPGILSPNVCCVDYSVAKNGKLVAYRWDGEQVLDNTKFVIARG